MLDGMPKAWTESIAAHRADVREAILHSVASLLSEKGMLSLTMSEIAARAGIGRATLYKHFSDVEAILLAWHERQISAHLDYLAEVRGNAADARRLEAVLEAYAMIVHESRGHHDGELAAFLHRDGQVAAAQLRVREMLRALVAEGVHRGTVRDDVPPDELAGYCLAALTAAGNLPSKAAVRRLVEVTLAGLRSG